MLGCFSHLRTRLSKTLRPESFYSKATSSMNQLAKIRSVEAAEMRDSASNRKRRGQIYAKVFQTNLPLSANLLTEPQVLLSHNFLSRQYVLHTKYVVLKEKWLGLLTLWLSRKKWRSTANYLPEDLADIQDVLRIKFRFLRSFHFRNCAEENCAPLIKYLFEPNNL